MDSLISKHVLETKYEDLTKEAVTATKHHILHTISTVIAGSNAPGVKAVLDLVEDSGGATESTILVYGNKVPAINAALVNSTMAHAQDYCMNDDRTFYKTSVVAIPVALAVAEKMKEVTGKELITAVCLGVDLGVRIALAINPKPSHALSPMLGGFASTTAAARLLGLNEEQFLDALGIAYCQVSASGGSTISPSLTKRLQPGLAARAGVFSALLAKKGFKSARNIFQGPKGYFVTYHGVEGDLKELTADLGKRWEIVNVGPKGYPCCRVLHAPIDATLALVHGHDIRPEEVEKVSVRGSRNNLFMAPDAITIEALEKRRHPRGVVDAQFSIPWAVATGIAKREVFIENFTEQGIKDLEIHKIADKVNLLAERSLENENTMLAPVVVEIETKKRGVFSQRVDFPKGNPMNPVTIEETRQNFRKCAAYAAKQLAKGKIDQAIEMIDNLEEVDNVNKLTVLLST